MRTHRGCGVSPQLWEVSSFQSLVFSVHAVSDLRPPIPNSKNVLATKNQNPSFDQPPCPDGDRQRDASFSDGGCSVWHLCKLKATDSHR